jgi:hypothetical protein
MVKRVIAFVQIVLRLFANLVELARALSVRASPAN